MRFITSSLFSLTFLAGMAAAGSTVVVNEGGDSISNAGHDCSRRATDAHGNSGCTLYENIGGTALVIDADTTIATATVPQTDVFQNFDGTTVVNGMTVGIATTKTGSAQMPGVTDVQINDGTTVVNGMTVGAMATSASKTGNAAAPAVTRAAGLEVAVAALAAGGIAAVF